MSKVKVLLLVALALASVPAVEEQGPFPVIMPGLVGQALYPASRTLRALGITPEYRQVSADTALVPEFHVAGQSPAADSAVCADTRVVLEFNCPGELLYWDDWVLPMLGDFRQQVGFYRVQQPPEPIRIAGAGYPPELHKYAFSGRCIVEALVDFDGSVLAAKVVESSGLAVADSAALDAALRSEFHPAEHYESPVRVWFPLPYHWEHREQLEFERSRPGQDSLLDP